MATKCDKNWVKMAKKWRQNCDKNWAKMATKWGQNGDKMAINLRQNDEKMATK